MGDEVALTEGIECSEAASKLREDIVRNREEHQLRRSDDLVGVEPRDPRQERLDS
jgi:hypothetical protein